MKHRVAVGAHWNQIGDGIDGCPAVHQRHWGQVMHLDVAITNLTIPFPKLESTYLASNPVGEDARRAVGWASLVLVHDDPGSCPLRHFHHILDAFVGALTRDEQLQHQRQTGKRNLACEPFDRSRVPRIRAQPAVTLDLE